MGSSCGRKRTPRARLEELAARFRRFEGVGRSHVDRRRQRPFMVGGLVAEMDSTGRNALPAVRLVGIVAQSALLALRVRRWMIPFSKKLVRVLPCVAITIVHQTAVVHSSASQAHFRRSCWKRRWHVVMEQSCHPHKERILGLSNWTLTPSLSYPDAVDARMEKV